jgi:hypothetical protein
MESEMEIRQIVENLLKDGNTVEIDPAIPGLFRVNGGPELTIGQMKAVYGAKTEPHPIRTTGRVI